MLKYEIKEFMKFFVLIELNNPDKVKKFIIKSLKKLSLMRLKLIYS